MPPTAKLVYGADFTALLILRLNLCHKPLLLELFVYHSVGLCLSVYPSALMRVPALGAARQQLARDVTHGARDLCINPLEDTLHHLAVDGFLPLRENVRLVVAVESVVK